jgi:thymidylate kinase
MKDFRLLFIKNNMFIIIDGIDGSGKSTTIDAWTEYLINQGKKVFNLKTYWQEKKEHPSAADLADYEVIISSEPTLVWFGAAIRGEMIKHGSDYSPLAIANAYALDRLVLYKRVLLPLREQGKIIIQDRGVSTSLCYQPLQENGGLTMDMVAKIEGNAFALEHAPDHLVITDVTIENSINRLGGRTEKQDNAIFEKAAFLEKARTRFLDPEYQKHFTTRGTKIHVLNGNENIDIMRRDGIDFLKKLIG